MKNTIYDIDTRRMRQFRHNPKIQEQVIDILSDDEIDRTSMKRMLELTLRNTNATKSRYLFLGFMLGMVLNFIITILEALLL